MQYGRFLSGWRRKFPLAQIDAFGAGVETLRIAYTGVASLQCTSARWEAHSTELTNLLRKDHKRSDILWNFQVLTVLVPQNLHSTVAAPNMCVNSNQQSGRAPATKSHHHKWPQFILVEHSPWTVTCQLLHCLSVHIKSKIGSWFESSCSILFLWLGHIARKPTPKTDGVQYEDQIECSPTPL